jgi:holo-[acyl-carrier protein] synthase
VSPSPGERGSVPGLGIDLIEIDRVEAALRRRPQLADRLFRQEELAACEGRSRPGRHLAARFAAKEAALKVVRRGDEGVGWRCVEVVRDEAGWVRLALSGRAESLAAEAGVSELALSLTHEGGLAVAVVVAEVARPDGPGGGT